ncbi:MAG: YceI family protein [Gammaproteobacteria bacterium]|nr:YceI family protein [Gammaproteobacteria bacterium]
MKSFKLVALAGLIIFSPLVSAADYKIDTKGMHAFIQFRIQHLGFSWLYGQFNDFSGEYSYDQNNPEAAKASVVIQAASLDSNHAERDKHLRSDDFLNTDKYPEIRFTSTQYRPSGDSGGMLYGNLTLHGVTKPIAINIEKIGEGKDPWGGYRSGFSGTAEINRSDFGVDKNLGPASEKVEIILSIEGIRI